MIIATRQTFHRQLDSFNRLPRKLAMTERTNKLSNLFDTYENCKTIPNCIASPSVDPAISKKK